MPIYAKKVLHILYLCATLLLTACASQPDYTRASESFSSTRSISINKEVWMTDKPFVQMPYQVWAGAVAGATGAIVTANLPDSERYKILLSSNQVDLRAILLTSVNNALKPVASSLKMVPEKGDTELHVAIPFYGIHGSGPFAVTSLEPMLSVEMKIVDPDGKVLWVSTESIKFPSRKQVDAHTMSEYSKNPALLSDGYAKLSDIIVTTLVSRLSEAKQIAK